MKILMLVLSENRFESSEIFTPHRVSVKSFIVLIVVALVLRRTSLLSFC